MGEKSLKNRKYTTKSPVPELKQSQDAQKSIKRSYVNVL